MKHVIYDNDVCQMYDDIKENISDFFPDLDEDDNTPSDEEIWELAYEEVEDRLGDEQMNLDKELSGEIVLIGTYERWNGSFNVYKGLGTNNLGKALEKAVASWSGDNSFEIYVENGRMYISQRGHDNPTNPSVMEFRMLKPDKELYGKRRYQLMVTEPLGRIPAEIYGWRD